MTVNLSNVLRILGFLSLVLAAAFILPIATAIYYGEYFCMRVFIYTAFFAFFIGSIIRKYIPSSLVKFKPRDGFLSVVLAWLFGSALGAIPFVATGAIPNAIDAYFESVSGFTTTGSSILTDIEVLPRSVLMWRGFTHWLGGMGIVFLTVAFLANTGVKGQLMTDAESSGGLNSDKFLPRYNDVIKNLYYIYIFFTFSLIFLYLLGGMNLFDAMNHSFATVGTGGFSTYNDSLGHFKSLYIHWITIVYMILCGTNFSLFILLIRGKWKSFIKDNELRLYLGIIFIFSIIIFVTMKLKGWNTDNDRLFTNIVFQISSVLTTTGFATHDYEIWPITGQMLIFFCLLIGGCSSSTSGGIKCVRVVLALKLIKRAIGRKLHPSRIHPIKLNGRSVSQDISINVINFIFTYLFFMLICTGILTLVGTDLISSLSAVATCMGNMGPGFNIVGPTKNFSSLPEISKFVLCLAMIAGRLEVFTFLMLFSPHYWNSNKP